MIDYTEVSNAGSTALNLITLDAKRARLDTFLMTIAPYIEIEARKLAEGIIDEVNSAVSDRYYVRIVHEDGSDFVEVTTKDGEHWSTVVKQVVNDAEQAKTLEGINELTGAQARMALGAILTGRPITEAVRFVKVYL